MMLIYLVQRILNSYTYLQKLLRMVIHEFVLFFPLRHHHIKNGVPPVVRILVFRRVGI